MMPAFDLHELGNRLWQHWLDLPRESQWLHGSAAFLLFAFVFLYWTPLGNKRAGVKCLVLALLFHVLAYGFVRFYDLGKRPPAGPAVVRVRVELAPPRADKPMALRSVDDPRASADPAAIRRPTMERTAETIARSPMNEIAEPPALLDRRDGAAVAPLPAAAAPETRREPVAKRNEPAPKPPMRQRPEPTRPERQLGPASTPDVVLPSQSSSLASANGAPALVPAPLPEEVAASTSARRPPTPAETPAAIAAAPRRAAAEKAVRRSTAADADPTIVLPAQRGLFTGVPGTAQHPEATDGESGGGGIAGMVGLAPAAAAPAPRGAPAAASTAAQGGTGNGIMSGPLAARAAPDRLAIVEQYGGSPQTEQAVADALAWLAAHQHPDGYWDSDGFSQHCPAGDVCSGPAIETGSDTGLTGLSLLAFLGAGHTHLASPRYSETVRRGLAWMLRRLAEDSDLRGHAGQGRIYCHAIATLALTEAYAMSRDERLKPWAQSAIDWLVRAQHGETGGWRYQPNQYGDTSVFGWVILALYSARGAGLEVPASTWTNAQRWLALASTGEHGGLAVYQPGHAPSPAMTAEAMVCRQLFGVPRANPAMVEGANYILRRPPKPSDYQLYYWYYGTLAAFQLGGDQWRGWNEHLTATLLAAQRTSGHSRGSWDPQRPFGVDGGRIFTTAASALCLEVYYRYLPLYAGNESAEQTAR